MKKKCKECGERYQGLERRKHFHGKNHPRHGTRMTQEHKDIVSSTHKGKIVSQETRDKISEGNKGKIRSEKARRAMSIAHIGKGMGNKNAIGNRNVRGKRWKLSGEKRTNVIKNVMRAHTFVQGQVKWVEELGHIVRSGWEEKICLAFKDNNIRYLYEPNIFYLRGVGSYIPDLYVPKYKLWIEIKGWARPDSMKKWNTFKRKYKNKFRFLLLDKKVYNRILKIIGNS